MPTPQNGQRHLIEVRAVEACTLLSLVSLLYSGQFNKNKEEVLSAACKLGIHIPQQDSRDQESQIGKQTELVERACQTESLCTTVAPLPFECPNPNETMETVNLIGPSSWRTDQGVCTYAAAADITLTTLQNVQGNLDKMPFFQVMEVNPESAMYPTGSGPACVPQVYVCPPASSYQQPSTPLQPHPYPSHSTYIEPLASQGQSAVGCVSKVEEYALDGLAQFENNIPGFIKYFLDADSAQGAGQRGQCHRGIRGDVNTEGRARRVRRARVRGGCALRVEGLNIKKLQHNMERCGRVARSTWSGQGGGRVGRILDTRLVLKHQGRRRRQGRGVMIKEEGERGRSSSRGRPRKTESRGRLVEAVSQDNTPPVRRPKASCPLPLPDVSRNFSGTTPSEQKTQYPPAPSLMHTAALPAANQSVLAQPMDWLIDDVIAQLPFMPPISSATQNNQHGITNTATSYSNVEAAHMRMQSSVKLGDLSVTQLQPEGELSDILDSFLRTFEQHIAACDSDVPNGSQSNVTDGIQANGQFAHTHTSNTHATSTGSFNQFRVSMNTTASQSPTGSVSQSRPQVSSVRIPQKTSFYWQVSSEGKSETQRMTRSQRRKRKLENSEKQKEKHPAKKKTQGKKEALEKQGVEAPVLRLKKKKQSRQLHSEKKSISGKSDPRCNVERLLRKVISTPGACNVKCSTQSTKNIKKTVDRPQSSGLHGHIPIELVKKRSRLVGHAKRNRTKNLLQGSKLKMERGTGTKNMLTGSCPETALSAFELMKNILENQKEREEEVKITETRDRDGVIRAEGHNNTRINRKDEETRGRMEDAGGWTREEKRSCSGQPMGIGNQTTSIQQDLLSPEVHTLSEGERLTGNSYNKPTFDSVDSPNDSPFQSTLSESPDSNHAMTCSTEDTMLDKITDRPLVSHAMDADMSLVKLEHTQGSIDSSEEDKDVDVVEVSSSLSESFTVLPINTDIVLSSEEEEEDDEEEADINVTS